MVNITQKELDLLKQLRSNLADLKLDDEKNSDLYLIRWLRAREWNLTKSEDMLRKSLKWRKENDIDTILEWKAPDVYHKIYPMEVCGYDDEGRPVLVAPSRFFDINLFWKLDREEYFRYTVQQMEKLLFAMKKYSTPEKPVTQFIGVYDLGGFNFRAVMNRRGMALMQDNTKCIEENYPELIHKAYMVYTPRIFPIIFSMMKHFVPKRTIEKIEIYDSNKDKWGFRLQEHIPADVLPPRYGGTNEEFERTAFAKCGLQPGDRKVSITGEIEIDGFIETHVGAGKTLKYEYDIESPNSTIAYNFKTENYDIGFSVKYDSELVVPYQRIESQHKMQKGSILCEKSGKYTFIFDNTFSRLREKTLHLKVEIEDAFSEAAEEDPDEHSKTNGLHS